MKLRMKKQLLWSCNMNDTVWQKKELAQTYLTGVRGAIPLAQEQIEVMLCLIRAAGTGVSRFLDLGWRRWHIGTCNHRHISDSTWRVHGFFGTDANGGERAIKRPSRR